MTQVVLQPCSKGEPLRHFVDTVQAPVDISAHRDLLTGTTYETLQKVSHSGKIAMWGIVPNRSIIQYEKMEVGATALFVGDGKVFYVGVVAAIFTTGNSLNDSGATTTKAEPGNTCMPCHTAAKLTST